MGVSVGDRYYAQIVNPNHPHYPDFGWCTGEIMDSLNTGILELFEIENCRHGAASCYVRLGETGIRRQR